MVRFMLLLCCLVFTLSAHAGEWTEVLVKDGVTYVPATTLSSWLFVGFWNDGSITIGTKIPAVTHRCKCYAPHFTFYANQRTYLNNGGKSTLPVAPFYGRTRILGQFFLPLRAVCESIGAKIEWMPESTIVKGAAFGSVTLYPDGRYKRVQRRPVPKVPVLCPAGSATVSEPVLIIETISESRFVQEQEVVNDPGSN